MADKIQTLIDEMTGHLKAAQAIAAKAEADGDRDFTDPERGEVNDHMKKAQDAKTRLEQAKADERTRKAIADLGGSIGLAEGDDPGERGEKAARSGLRVPGRGKGQKSIGQHFVESAQFKALTAQAGPGGFSKEARVRTDPVGFKALVTAGGTGSADAFVNPDERGLLVGADLFYRPLSLRALVTNGTTTSDQIEYARITGFANNAAPVPEATSAAAGATTVAGGYKPESGFSTARVTTPVRTIAHWMPVTKRALSDAAQVRTLIDNFLETGLEEELEDQILAGDGTGENFEGLANVSGTQSQAWDTNLLVTTRKAKTKVRIGGRSVPNGYVLNPVDVEALDLSTNSTGDFYYGGPAAQNGGAASLLWGLPVIESEAVPVGTGWVGDWRKAILWDREQASVTATDTHSDFFVRNLVAVLAEMRAAFGVIQPSAFVEIDLTAGA